MGVLSNAEKAFSSPDRTRQYWWAGHGLIVLSLFLTLLIFFLGRLSLLVGFWVTGSGELELPYLLNDLLFGTRLDLKTIATVMLPVYLLLLLSGLLMTRFLPVVFLAATALCWLLVLTAVFFCLFKAGIYLSSFYFLFFVSKPP